MNQLQIFENPQFGKVRTIEDNGKVLFCGSDIAKALGYANAPDALNRHCRYIVKRDTATAQGNMSNMAFIPEGDVYRLITHSKLEAAVQFESWVFDEVIPSIRKTGSYSIDPEKRIIAEAKLNNSRARVSSLWLKIAETVPVPEYKQICASYASATLAGREVLPLPETVEHLYTATELGKMFGVSANQIGKLANANGIKTTEFGKVVWDKSPYSAKQVETFRYNDKAMQRFRQILGQ